ncbi:LacI family DNA-binding transcriptional regulator [Corynebacterium durum]|uniref:LacI family DNA-binding transcriptional regulator n=1 Tax=Corynebacterium durum TaxID=61592 RepID=UPI0017FB7728|nr:LacI family DNA-binding transcriptional regulator [Corynebacterium durum]NYI74037.1 LacI family transcriptional regulator [Corynebacterium durum]WJY85761.1 HTH-type transcriptional regulator DegA [Corynebacterium durum]
MRIPNPTLKDIAAEVGVSISTVSRALADHPAIPQKTKQRVLKAAQKLNYRPNAQARALRNSKTNTIGLVIPNLFNPYFAELAAAVQNAAIDAGLYTLLGISNDDPKGLIQAVEIMQHQRVDGIIAVPHIGTEKELTALAKQNVPLVLVDRELDIVPATSVSTDPAEGIKAAVSMLVTGGHESIGYLAGPQDTSTGVDRLEAFRSACGSFGIDQYPMLLGGYVEEQGYVGTQELLKLGVSAIIAGDSMMTVGALRACHEHRLTPGFDIALVGFDDFPVFQLQNPPLTIINQHVSTMGAKAFEELHKLLRGDSAQHKIKLPTTLIVRGSTPPKDSASDSSGQGGH